MRMQVLRFPRGARLGVGQPWSGAMRLSKSIVAVVLVSGLAAACADEGSFASATGEKVAKPPVRVRATRADARRASGSPITTASIGRAETGKTADLPYRPAVGSRRIGTIEIRNQDEDGQVPSYGRTRARRFPDRKQAGK